MFVRLPQASVFASPNAESEMIDEVIYGDKAEVTDNKNGFSRIITDYGYVGWVQESALADFDAAPTHTVISPFADLLTTDKYFYQPTLTLPFGARVRITQGNPDSRFHLAETPDGWFYIHKKHLSPINRARSEKEIRKAVAETALSYLGTQYRWGGRTRAGVDCSGLCFNAYRLNGINIWRDADISRSRNLRCIEYESALVGDLLFFKGHIAMYSGDGRIIHSSATAGRVVIEEFEKNGYLKEIYICTGTVF